MRTNPKDYGLPENASREAYAIRMLDMALATLLTQDKRWDRLPFFQDGLDVIGDYLKEHPEHLVTELLVDKVIEKMGEKQRWWEEMRRKPRCDVGLIEKTSS